MKRRQLIEWGDQPWLPSFLRRYLAELLQHQTSKIYGPVRPIITRWLRASGCREIIDLGSGMGGPWPSLSAALAEDGFDIVVTLSDQFPFQRDWQDVPNLNYCAETRSAKETAFQHKSGQTLFTLFHHFDPGQAQAFLQHASENEIPVAIFEFTERSWTKALGMFFSPLLVWVHTLWIRPFDWGRVFWTYPIPIIPIIYLWDGLISHLRSYSPDELRTMTESLDNSAYRWENGQVQNSEQGVTITYLLGFPL